MNNKGLDALFQDMKDEFDFCLAEEMKEADSGNSRASIIRSSMTANYYFRMETF